jgi:hypothetical protein
MTHRTESGVVPQGACCINRFSPMDLDTVETLTEVSVAALTTDDPELRDFGRALISLVRYYAVKTMIAGDVTNSRERGVASA